MSTAKGSDHIPFGFIHLDGRACCMGDGSVSWLGGGAPFLPYKNPQSSGGRNIPRSCVGLCWWCERCSHQLFTFLLSRAADRGSAGWERTEGGACDYWAGKDDLCSFFFLSPKEKGIRGVLCVTWCSVFCCVAGRKTSHEIITWFILI